MSVSRLPADFQDGLKLLFGVVQFKTGSRLVKNSDISHKLANLKTFASFRTRTPLKPEPEQFTVSFCD